MDTLDILLSIQNDLQTGNVSLMNQMRLDTLIAHLSNGKPKSSKKLHRITTWKQFLSFVRPLHDSYGMGELFYLEDNKITFYRTRYNEETLRITFEFDAVRFDKAVVERLTLNKLLDSPISGCVVSEEDVSFETLFGGVSAHNYEPRAIDLKEPKYAKGDFVQSLELDKAVLYVLKGVSKDETRSILKNIYLHKNKKGVALVGTDGFRAHILQLDNEYRMNKIFCGDALQFLFRKADTIEIDLYDKAAIYSYSADNYKVTIEQYDEYPNYPDVYRNFGSIEGYQVSLQVDVKELTEVLKQVIAVSKSEDKSYPIFYFIFEDNKIAIMEDSTKAQWILNKATADIKNLVNDPCYNAAYVLDVVSFDSGVEFKVLSNGQLFIETDKITSLLMPVHIS